MRRYLAGLMGLILLFCAGAAALGEEIVIPELTIQARPMPQNDALALIRDMKAGWNLGNTFDASNCFWVSDPLDYETAWCGERTTETLISALKAAGFGTIRIPVSWHDHLSGDWTIDPDWLDRVYEVASWAYERGLYVIINIHHDCDPSYYYPDAAHAENSAAYVRKIWTQVAEKFRDWDEHLIFECVNEPRLAGTDYEWYWDASVAECRDAMAQIVALNQVFTDTVRASGGRNADRYLLVPAYDASGYYACDPAFSLPADSAENRIIVSAHAYIPYDFALEQPGIHTFSLDRNDQKAAIGTLLNNLYETYVAKGIPVLMGEFGAMEKEGNLQDRVTWIAYYAAMARARGITCCLWDNNVYEGEGERFGLFNRTTGECVSPELLAAFMKYCE